MDPVRLRRYRNLRRRILYKGQYRLQGTEEYKGLSAEFLAFSGGISDQTARKIIVMYYRDVRSLVWISYALHYSESQIKRLKNAAITFKKSGF
ncbi:MAG: hypothetical protein E7638_06735 [Ruminococcaceae bacterium]|nr:hypothetical protein [Oscillospiraceae bacterium]